MANRNSRKQLIIRIGALALAALMVLGACFVTIQFLFA